MSGIRRYFPSLLLTLLLTYAVVAIQATAYAQSCSCEVSDRKERAYDHGAAKENAIEGFKATSLWPTE